MSLNREDLKEIKEYFDEVYVLQSDCSNEREKVNASFAKDDKRIDKLVDRMNLWNKLLWAIASSSIGALVISFFELILK